MGKKAHLTQNRAHSDRVCAPAALHRAPAPAATEIAVFLEKRVRIIFSKSSENGNNAHTFFEENGEKRVRIIFSKKFEKRQK